MLYLSSLYFNSFGVVQAALSNRQKAYNIISDHQCAIKVDFDDR